METARRLAAELQSKPEADASGGFSSATVVSAGKDKAFSDMEQDEQSATLALGWSGVSWDGGDEAPFTTHWDDLEPKLQQAARLLGLEPDDFGQEEEEHWPSSERSPSPEHRWRVNDATDASHGEQRKHPRQSVDFTPASEPEPGPSPERRSEEEDLAEPIPESPQLSPILALEVSSHGQASPLVKTGGRGEPPQFTVRFSHRFEASSLEHHTFCFILYKIHPLKHKIYHFKYQMHFASTSLSSSLQGLEVGDAVQVMSKSSGGWLDAQVKHIEGAAMPGGTELLPREVGTKSQQLSTDLAHYMVVFS